MAMSKLWGRPSRPRAGPNSRAVFRRKKRKYVELLTVRYDEGFPIKQVVFPMTPSFDFVKILSSCFISVLIFEKSSA